MLIATQLDELQCAERRSASTMVNTVTESSPMIVEFFAGQYAGITKLHELKRISGVSRLHAPSCFARVCPRRVYVFFFWAASAMMSRVAVDRSIKPCIDWTWWMTDSPVVFVRNR